MNQSLRCLITSFLLIITACTNFDQTPKERLPDPPSQTEIEDMLAHSYQVLRIHSMNGVHIFPRIWQEVRGRDSRYTFYHIYANTTLEDYSHYTPDDEHVSLLWKKWWMGVDRVNPIINTAEFVDWDSEGSKRKVLSEALVLRAFFYLELVKMWGSVPIVLSDDNMDYTRQPVASVYQNINADLNRALRVGLPLKSETAVGNITSGLAHALLAKVALYQEDWVNVVLNTEAIISSGEYALEPNFGDNFSLDNENGIESIFEIQFEAGDEYYETAGENALGSLYAQFCFMWVNEPFTSFSHLLPRGELKSLFDKSTDTRRQATFIEAGTNLSEWSEGLADEWGLDETGIIPENYMSWLGPDPSHCNYGSKHFISWEVAISIPEFSQSPLNENVIRYAEILLMHAEASLFAPTALQSGQTSLDMVTDRAYTNDPRPVLTLSELKLQRRLELATEGWNRFTDIMRWGDKEELLFAQFVVGRDELLPIPQAAIDEHGLKQNPGY